MGRCLRLTALSFLVLTWLFAARAQAGDVRANLVWQRRPDSHCPARADLEADVESVVGHPVFTADSAADVTVRGSVEEREDGVHVHIEATSRDGAVLGLRRLEAPVGQCASLRGAITLVLIVLLDSVAARDGVEGVAPSGSALGLGAALGVWTGLVPRAAFASGVSLWVAPGPSLALQAEASYWLPVDVETAGGLGGRLQAAGLAARVCPRVAGSFRAHSLALCAGAQGGAMFITPRALTGPEHQVRLLAQGLLELRGRFRLPGFALEGALGALASFTRPRFSYEDSDGRRAFLFRAAPVGIFFSIGVIRL